MKSLLTILFVLIQLPAILAQGLPITPCHPETANSTYSKASELQVVLENLVHNGVPGCSMAVYSEEGWWTGSAGFAKIETKTPMQTCNLLYLQSISKTYMAVAVLKLYEQGKIKLDDPITNYLPQKISSYITRAETITVKMLLNHTSGVPEYNSIPAYISKLLQDPDHYYEPVDYLKYIEGKPLDFTPGSRYSYRNTNFVILSLITDAITGDHSKFIADIIFKPLHLTHTFYRGDTGYLNYPELVNSYWDRYSDGVLENASRLQRNNVLALVGDDGIVTTPVEAVQFLKGLMEGKLIAPETLELMKSWVNDRNGNPTYGLGLDYATFAGHKAYGHSGGGIGAGCQLYYFPDEKVYMFIGINLGTVTDSPIQKQAMGILENIHKILLE